MVITKVPLLLFLGAYFFYDVNGQGGVLTPGNYQLTGSMKVLANGKVNLKLNPVKGRSGGPPSIGPTVGTGTGPTGTAGPPSVPTSGSASPSAGIRYAGGSQAQQVGLQAHNKYRQVHNAPSMQLDPQLNSDAQQYAGLIAQLGKLEHSNSRKGAGENLGLQCARGSDADLVQNVVDSWYKEVCDYDFNNHQGFSPLSKPTGHFTQVVWKGSTNLGIGFARGTYITKDGRRFSNCIFVVGRYKEAGNMRGAYQQNVEKGGFNRETFCRQSDITITRKRDVIELVL